MGWLPGLGLEPHAADLCSTRTQVRKAAASCGGGRGGPLGGHPVPRPRAEKKHREPPL